MRLCKLWLDGYGKFTGKEIDLTPGLQVIVGPNERGKTTVRCFIADMLYGQKRSVQQRSYDESHELRRPWQDGDTYSGRLTYVLDRGREVEIQRVFEKKREGVHVFDLSIGREITSEFSVLRNREPSFAEEHLGLSKSIFLNVATIGHSSLDHLGDEDALTQIREKILGLADSSDESGSADAALRVLTERVGLIGRPAPQSKRPLPLAKARLAELDEELAKARACMDSVSNLERERTQVNDELATLRKRRDLLEEDLRAIERRDRSKRLEEIDKLQARIDELTQQCFALSSVREFPIEQTPDVQRAANAAVTARAQVERTRNEMSELQRQLREENERLGSAAHQEIADIPEETEQELAELESKIARLTERAETLDAERGNALERMAQAQRELESLPDYSWFAADPVEWLTQLATSFRLAHQSRDRAISDLERLREEIKKREADLVEPARIFEEFSNFPDELRHFEVQQRVFEGQSEQLNARIEQLQAAAADRSDASPSALWFSGLVAIIAVALLAAAIVTGNNWVFLPAGISVVAFVYFIFNWVFSRLASTHSERELHQALDELHTIEDAFDEIKESLEKAVKAAGYESIRELEALYDRYTKDSVDLAAMRSSLDRLESEVQEEIERVTQLFARLEEQFRQLNEEVADEAGVQTATGRAIARYQEYRDAKRRLAEVRDRPAQLQLQLDQTLSELDAAKHVEVERSLEVRRLMREAGFREEQKHTSAIGALRAYRIRTAQLRQKRGRIDVLNERTENIERRLEEELKDLEKQEEALSRRLDAGGAKSIEHWHELAKQAKSYRDIWDERTRRQEKIEALLRGERLEDLRRAVEQDGPCYDAPDRNLEELKAELQSVRLAIDSNTKEEHELHIGVTQRAAGQRSINEIEEERESVAVRMECLELEMEATSYAASLIEEVARDKHARIAPRMASLAGQYLSEITGGAYKELLISRDFGLTVRIPTTERLHENPERFLSKGTVDQIYLALRLALVQSLSEGGESVPLLLDDPFANYDEGRLTNALRLLRAISETHQVLLFTCREDVARSAETLSIPVLAL